jgi:hypothetical protein
MYIVVQKLFDSTKTKLIHAIVLGFIPYVDMESTASTRVSNGGE